MFRFPELKYLIGNSYKPNSGFQNFDAALDECRKICIVAIRVSWLALGTVLEPVVLAFGQS